MHIYIGKLDNGLLPIWHQAIIQTYACLLSIGPLQTYFKWNLNRITIVFIEENAFENATCKMLFHDNKWSVNIQPGVSSFTVA